MRAVVAVGADIDDEGAGRHVDLVGTEEEEHVERALLRHRGGVERALARHKADLKRTDARGRGVQHAVAVPALLDDAKLDGGLRRQRRDSRAVRPRQRAGAEDDHRTLGRFKRLREAVLAASELRERVGPAPR